jgi:hypothetical protein
MSSVSAALPPFPQPNLQNPNPLIAQTAMVLAEISPKKVGYCIDAVLRVLLKEEKRRSHLVYVFLSFGAICILRPPSVREKNK